MHSRARTVKEYLASLPEERRSAVEAVRKVIRANLASEFEEGMQYGMVGYFLPHRIFPPGYHCDPSQPLPLGGLASQKSHLSLYLMSLHANSQEETRLKAEWAKTGKKLDMGKCCIRFKTVESLALDVIAAHLRRLTAASYIETYLKNLPPSKRPTTTAGSAPKARKPAGPKERGAVARKAKAKKASAKKGMARQ
jgi:hypothetical protein